MKWVKTSDLVLGDVICSYNNFKEICIIISLVNLPGEELYVDTVTLNHEGEVTHEMMNKHLFELTV